MKEKSKGTVKETREKKEGRIYSGYAKPNFV